MLDRITEARNLLQPALDAGVISNPPFRRFSDYLVSINKQVQNGRAQYTSDPREIDGILRKAWGKTTEKMGGICKKKPFNSWRGTKQIYLNPRNLRSGR